MWLSQLSRPQPGNLYIWDETQSFHGGEKGTIPHLKENIQGFQMTPNTQIFISELVLFWAESHPKWALPRILHSKTNLMD